MGFAVKTVYEPGCFAHVALLTHASYQVLLEGYSDDVWATPHLVCIQSVFYLSACVVGGYWCWGGGGWWLLLFSQLLQHVPGLINMVVKIFDMKNFWAPYQSKKHPELIHCCLEMVWNNAVPVCLLRTDRLSTSRILDVIQLLLRSVVYHTEADV